MLVGRLLCLVLRLPILLLHLHPQPLELTLEGDRWSPELNIGERGRELVLELLRGLRAKTKYAAGQALASTEPRGWDTVGQPQLKAHHVGRVDDTTVRLEWDAAAAL